jgi:hypothetical protein
MPDVRSDARRSRLTEGVGGRGLAAVFDLGEAQVRSFSLCSRFDHLQRVVVALCDFDRPRFA